MKATRLLVTLATLTAVPFATAAEVNPGDSFAAVQSVLGSPRGQVQLEGRKVLYYPRGEVELVGDRVIRVALRSAEEQADLEVRSERRRSAQEARLSQLQAEGGEVRDQKLADADFKSAPLAYQVSYWENFARLYPGVSVVEPLAIARLRLSEQRAEQRRKEDQAARIAELETRLAESQSRLERYSTLTPAYGYSGRHHQTDQPFNPYRDVRYDFNTTTGAPYETPRGAPYETPRGAPYVTPTAPVVDLPTGNPARPGDAATGADGDWSRGRNRY